MIDPTYKEKTIAIEHVENNHLAIYLINRYQLEGILTGKTRILNIPEGAKIYKVLLWKHDECDGTIAVWFSHPDFREVYPGDLVETIYPHFEQHKSNTEVT